MECITNEEIFAELKNLNDNIKQIFSLLQENKSKNIIKKANQILLSTEILSALSAFFNNRIEKSDYPHSKIRKTEVYAEFKYWYDRTKSQTNVFPV